MFSSRRWRREIVVMKYDALHKADYCIRGLRGGYYLWLFIAGSASEKGQYLMVDQFQRCSAAILDKIAPCGC
ncbi:hypothetical protein N7486_005944 [Penicillium sp. IBT 16267x]|nr:hypothetical protein N7486_005944 [Penicillium sp. IBT 16267x]